MSADIQSWIDEAKGRDILAAAAALGAVLKRQGSEHVGACPLGCVGNAKRKGGHDGFAVNTRKQMFLCRPGGAGGTVIDMVMHVMGLEFMAACEWLNGAPAPGRAASAHVANAAPPAPLDGKADAEAESAYRATEIGKARAIFEAGTGIAGTFAAAYLEARGISISSSSAWPLRFSREQPYWHGDNVVWRGPAMLAAVTNAGGELTAAHITWLDPDRPGAKAAIEDPEHADALLPAKKLRGTKRHAAIKLVSPRDPARLVIGEGIETTASVYEAERGTPSASGCAYWAGIDLGHIGGKAAASIAHPTRKGPKGKPARVGGPVPQAQPDRDLEIPDTVRELVILGDGDSDPFTTRMALYRASARWAKPGRIIRVAWAPAGADFNDLLLGADGAARILEIIAAAEPFAPLELAADPPKPARRQPSEKKRPASPIAGSSETAEIAAAAEEGPAWLEEEIPELELEGDDLPPDIIERCALEPMNDTGNGMRLLYWFGDRILHVREVGWHFWTGTHWSKEGGDEFVMRCAQKTAERIKLERSVLAFTVPEQRAVDAAEKAELELKGLADDAPAAERRRLAEAIAAGRAAMKALGGRKGDRASHAKLSGNSAKIAGMIQQAIPRHIAGNPVSVDPGELDKDPHAFNLLNGTLRFVRVRDDECPDPDVIRFKWLVRLDPHRPADLIAKCAPVEYDAEATAPAWFKFIERVQPDRVMRNFLRDFHGYGLTGLTGIQAFVFNAGGGANGKSTFIECLMRIVGDYGHSLNPESLTGANQRRGDQATPDLADLPGVRLLRVSELPARAKLQESLIKTLTGGEGAINVRHNYAKRFFKLHPVFKASMSGNAKPEIHDDSEGMWRRLLLVPWNVKVPVEEREEFEEMQRRFKAEWPGILNWLIEGCLTYLDAGRLELPDEVVAATAEHRDDMDPVGHFLEECVERAPGCKVTGGELYAVYLAFCRDGGLKPFQQTTFGKTVPKHGWAKAKSGVVSYLDMRLRADAPMPLDYDGARSPRSPHEGD